MKKTVIFVTLLLTGFFCFGQVEMPYLIKYQIQGDTIYRHTKTIEGIHINVTEQEVITGEGSEVLPLSYLDTIYVYKDKFRKYVGEMGDWDEVLFSNDQLCLYKENDGRGMPRALLSLYVNDTVPEGYFVFTTFDEDGFPEFMNFNDSCFMKINRYYEEYFDAVIIASDMFSLFTLDSVRMDDSLGRVNERYEALVRAGYDLTPAQRAIALQHLVSGGVSMVMGAGGMLAGCAMLTPGVNIAMGATIALLGTAGFISGALLTTHASDQLLTGGNEHTQGYEESAFLFGLIGSITNWFSFGTYLLSDGFYSTLEDSLLHVESSFPYERAQRMRNMGLTATGNAALLDPESHTARLFGSIREKLDPNDRFGIMICRDRDALTVEQCQLLDVSHPTGTFYCDFSNLEPLGGYYYRSYYYSTELASYGTVNPWVVSLGIKSFRMPGVITLEHEQGNSSNSYWLHGAFQDVAGQTSHTVGFCYSYSNETPTYDDEHMQQTVYDNGEFTDHLFLNSQYNCCYYRAYAIIDGQIAYGEVRQIGVAVTTYQVENITSTTATCWGEIVCGGTCDVTERGVCWSTSHNPTTSGSHINEGQGTGYYSCTLTGLTSGTTYYVRAYAIVDAETLYGNEVHFTTTSLPTVTTSQVTNIGEHTATGGGNVTDDGGSPVTERGVCWSTSHNPTTSNSHATSGSGTGAFTVSMTGLTAHTTYYVRAYATNSVGTEYGNEISFSTLGLPTVTTTQVTNIGEHTATGGGNVTDDGGSPVTARGICWSTSHNPTTSNSHATSGSGTGTFTVNMTGLSANTTYFVRAYATNSIGTEYGNEVSFSTITEPIVITLPVTNITSTTAMSGCVVNDGGSNMMRSGGVCWSTNHNPTIDDQYISVNDGGTVWMRGLTPNTTYYVRAYFWANSMYYYGEEMTFTTSSYAIYFGNGMYNDTIRPRFPAEILFCHSIAACIYRASELASAGVTTHPITSLSWCHNHDGSIGFWDIKIWMANVSYSEAPSVSPSVLDMTLVYEDNHDLDLEGEFPGWYEFCFNQNSFAWDGHSNILIFVQRNGCWYGGTWRGTGGGSVSYSFNDGGPVFHIETSTYNMSPSTFRPDIIINQHIP